MLGLNSICTQYVNIIGEERKQKKLKGEAWKFEGKTPPVLPIRYNHPESISEASKAD